MGKKLQKRMLNRKKQIVFLPYKAAMWDSLESIWQAACRDPQCEAYVMPIPYYDRNMDTSLGTMHYEGDLFPAEVPILSYKEVDLQKWHPDVIYIHNPYDNLNFVTSVDPAYYSAELKQCTELLMYVPYYATSGGMSEAQANCAAYANVDYIVIQAEFLRRFFAPSLPAEKIIALGSPKFDRVIHMCQDPSEPPAEWKTKMQGRKVYFYNTSLGGMYENTENFLKKIEYVFQLFQGRADACLLWRPHPLLESAIQASREPYYPAFLKLKQYFIENDLGIYDETPDIDLAIAWSEVYIGDAGTSVTSLFGVAGKPLFILNNNIHELPQGDDWRGEVITMNFLMDKEQWMITANNKLYHAQNRDYRFSYCGTLSGYGSGSYYSRAWTIEGKTYICPAVARNIIEIDSAGHPRVISLNPFEGQPGAFAGSWTYGPYLLLIPFRYPSIVRYNTRSGEIAYLEGVSGFFVNQIQSEWLIGGSCIWQGKLVIGSPAVSKLLIVDIEASKLEVVDVGAQSNGGIMGIVPHGDELWLMPYRGQEILCWNGVEKTLRRYTGMPEGFSCLNRGKRIMGEDRPFASAAFTDDDEHIILAPCWANMFVCIERATGRITRWECPFDASPDQRNGYFPNWGIGGFAEKTGANRYRFVYSKEHRLYDVNLVTKECQEIPVELTEEGRNHYPAGFCELSESVRYGCEEGAMNTLKDLLDGTIHGTAFDRNHQLRAYGEVAANRDGTSGEKIHQWAMSKLSAKNE